MTHCTWGISKQFKKLTKSLHSKFKVSFTKGQLPTPKLITYYLLTYLLIRFVSARSLVYHWSSVFYTRNYGYTTFIKRNRYKCDKDSHRSHISQNFQTSGNEMSHAVWWPTW